MVSNGFSARRGPLRRPKVCTASPNPGRCHPPPPPPGECECLLDPEHMEINVESEDSFTLYVCCGDLPGGESVEWEVSSTIGIADKGDAEPTNCEDMGDVQFEAPDEPGTGSVTVTVTFSDLRTCVVTSTITVTADEE